jgi:hypothetical protein
MPIAAEGEPVAAPPPRGQVELHQLDSDRIGDLGGHACQETRMQSPIVHVRFVGMLPSGHAEAAARDAIRSLQSVFTAVARWDVCVRPPLVAQAEGGYSVRVQARLAGGGLVSILAQAGTLLETVREAFEGVLELLHADGAEAPGREGPAWLPPQVGSPPALPA